VPVIGIVQVGDQAMADRYAYVPLIGLFVILVWGTAEIFERYHVTPAQRWTVVFTVLATLAFVTFKQIGYWENSVTIWSRTLQLTTDNLPAERQLATALVANNDIQGALPHFIAAARLDPGNITAIVNIGAYYAAQGRLQEASQEFETAIKSIDHRNLSEKDEEYRASAFLNLGFVYALSHEFPKALVNLENVTQSNSAMVDQTVQTLERSLANAPSQRDYLKLSLLLRAKGKEREAVSVLQDAIKSRPDYLDARELLNYLATN
jgi:tetratricopeptide (TPR) repeat protein